MGLHALIHLTCDPKGLIFTFSSSRLVRSLNVKILKNIEHSDREHLRTLRTMIVSTRKKTIRSVPSKIARKSSVVLSEFSRRRKVLGYQIEHQRMEPKKKVDTVINTVFWQRTMSRHHDRASKYLDVSFLTA